MLSQLAIEHGMTGLLVSAVAAYLLGSIPFGLLLTHAAGLGDIRAIGSGNIGTTNVLRTGRKGLAAATLLLDAGKGAAAVVLAMTVLYTIGADLEAAITAIAAELATLVESGVTADDLPGAATYADTVLSANAAAVAGLFAVLGHMFPVWLGFRGGKGAATGFGVYLAISLYVVGPLCLLLWLLIALISRYASAASLISFLAAPFLFYLLGPAFFAGMALIITVLVWIKHRENIVRLVRGQESRINLGGSRG